MYDGWGGKIVIRRTNAATTPCFSPSSPNHTCGLCVVSTVKDAGAQQHALRVRYALVSTLGATGHGGYFCAAASAPMSTAPPRCRAKRTAIGRCQRRCMPPPTPPTYVEKERAEPARATDILDDIAASRSGSR